MNIQCRKCKAKVKKLCDFDLCDPCNIEFEKYMTAACKISRNMPFLVKKIAEWRGDVIDKEVMDIIEDVFKECRCGKHNERPV